MGVVFALLSALSYGLSDVVGGVVARRMNATTVALLGQVGGLVTVGVAAPLLTPGLPQSPDLLWGGLSGVGTGFGMAFLFRGLSRGAMSVVGPVSAVGGVALPVLVGTVLLGDRPSWPAWVGVVLAVPSLWIISRGSSEATGPIGVSLRYGGLAGVGIAIQYLALAQADSSAGLWPVLSGRVTAVVTVAVLAASSPSRRESVTAQRLLAAGYSGVLAAAALTAYLLAAHTELVTVAVVLSSLYPVVPVVFGVTVLGERLRRNQLVGLAAALVATVLIAAT
jgi:uncharacterized membrane protein